MVEVVHGALFSSLLRHAETLVELPGVLVAVIQVHHLGEDVHLLPNHKVINGKELFVAGTEDLLALQERPLRNSRVFLFIFNDLNAVIFKIIV